MTSRKGQKLVKGEKRKKDNWSRPPKGKGAKKGYQQRDRRRNDWGSNNWGIGKSAKKIWNEAGREEQDTEEPTNSTENST